MTKLLELVPKYIDLIGRTSLSAKAKEKAAKNRQATKVEAFKDTLNERQIVVQRKKVGLQLGIRGASSNDLLVWCCDEAAP